METTVTRLKVAVAEDGRPAYVIAAEAQVHPVQFSKFSTGREIPTDAIKARIAAALKRDVLDVFPEAS